jgi:hypothetical protein
MSSFRYQLGHLLVRRRRWVIVAWLLVVVVAGSLAGFNKGTDDTYAVPGAQSQDALDYLGRVFPETSGSSAQLVIVASVGNVLPTHAAILALRGGGHRVEHHHWRALELAIWMIGAAVATLFVTERRRSLSGRQLRLGNVPLAEV